MSPLENLDRDWTLAINSLHCPFTDSVWLVFSDTRIWFVLYLAVAVLMFWRLGWKKALTMVVATALCIVCIDQGCNIVKDAVARLRPCNDPGMTEAGLWMLAPASVRHPYGFFSAHAANAFGFATCTTVALRQDKRRKWRGYAAAVFVWALLVSASRIFVGRHFLGDVLVGIAAGCLLGQGFTALARLFIRKVLS